MLGSLAIAQGNQARLTSILIRHVKIYRGNGDFRVATPGKNKNVANQSERTTLHIGGSHENARMDDSCCVGFRSQPCGG
jgi:hypothetical protein